MKGIPLIKEGDDLGKIIVSCINANKLTLMDSDILVIAQKIVSKAEGRVVNLNSVSPSYFATKIAEYMGKDPRKIELVLRETKAIIRMSRKVLITETHQGLICANSGVDLSNAGLGECATLLPLNPDKSADRIRRKIKEISGVNVGIIISDTQGRVLRRGAVGVAIGISGLPSLVSYRGKKDLFDYVLKSSVVCFADEIASAAQLVMGESDEGIPVVLIRGLKFKKSNGAALELVRPREESVFF
ncbi:MAG: coenzyme F420-0:L-glutamate ligase [Candidatus Odinarchaeia archaeon]